MVEQSPMLEVNQCPSWAAALGYMGVAVAVCLSNWGAAVSHATDNIHTVQTKRYSSRCSWVLNRRSDPDLGVFLSLSDLYQ